MSLEWKTSACILCSINCGLTLGLQGRRIRRVRGDRAHPTSRGYLCEKPQSLDHYQSGRDRITAPMRRRADGTYEAVGWDAAIAEVAARLARVRDAHGGASIFYYGGGGQGNHLQGAYGRATRAALGSVYTSNALAQEKTGEFWVDGRLFGRARCHTAPDFERAEVAMFVGKNPWQSHGFPRARKVIQDIARDPERCLIVIDPRVSETAARADIHLRVRPGGDAYLLAALLKALFEGDHVDRGFVDARCANGEGLLESLARVDVATWSARAGVHEALVRRAAARLGAASSVSILEDLGVQQAPQSTLNSYLEKLLYVLTGNFAKPGGMNIHTRFAGLGGGSGARRDGSPVGGHRIIGGLLPCNVIPDEILSDHPDRFRAMIVESANPVHSLADSQRMREAMRALEFSVVIDVAMTETAREADYVLPAASQYEKWEATFFNLEFPHNAFHLRRPILEPLDGALPEAEIHARLVEALGALDGLELSGLRAAASRGLDAFAVAFAMAAGADRRLMKLAPVVLYEVMAPLLPEGGRSVAVIWALAHQCAMRYPDAIRRAGIEGAGPLLGNALFRAALESPSGLVFTHDPYEETWRRVETPDGRINLSVPELLAELDGLDPAQPPARPAGFPLVLSAGERRSSTANTIFRDPDWRSKDRAGALRVSPQDAERLGLTDGGRARLTTQRGAAQVVVEVSEMMQSGHVSLPNGQGLRYPSPDGDQLVGVAPNELTAGGARDPVAGTPWHKHVPARLEAL